MQRNERTTLGLLLPGDRFFFRNDKDRLVWEVISQGERYTYINQPYCNAYWYTRHVERQQKTEVVYLSSRQSRAEALLTAKP